jgi:hypothetical protein
MCSESCRLHSRQGQQQPLRAERCVLLPLTGHPLTNTHKRSHAEITRSRSRSSSDEPLSKRRRTDRIPQPSLTPPPTLPLRRERDGLDFRRPVMSSANNYVDLTATDDDDDIFRDPDSMVNEFLPDEDLLDEDWAPRFFERDQVRDTGQGNAQPAQLRNPQATFIDLSSDDEPTQSVVRNQSPGRQLRRDSTSSEVVFVGERTATPPGNNRRPSLRDRRPTPGPPRDRRRPRNMAAPPPLPTVRGFAGLGGLPNLLRRTLFGQTTTGRPEMPPLPVPADMMADELEIIHFNYGNPAFPMGDRSSEPAQVAPGDAYKEPEPIPDGFAGDIEEDGVYICAMCDEELATGNSEEKQQVWVSKQCGHVSAMSCNYIPWLILAGVLRWLRAHTSTQDRLEEGEESQRHLQDMHRGWLRRECHLERSNDPDIPLSTAFASVRDKDLVGGAVEIRSIRAMGEARGESGFLLLTAKAESFTYINWTRRKETSSGSLPSENPTDNPRGDGLMIYLAGDALIERSCVGHTTMI